jgi:hypothetical protein
MSPDKFDFFLGPIGFSAVGPTGIIAATICFGIVATLYARMRGLF